MWIMALAILALLAVVVGVPIFLTAYFLFTRRSQKQEPLPQEPSE